MRTEMPQIYKRKGGGVFKLTAEIDFGLYQRFNKAIYGMEMTKRQAVQTALSFWLNYLDGMKGGSNHG
jgi:hypothetical protein